MLRLWPNSSRAPASSRLPGLKRRSGYLRMISASASASLESWSVLAGSGGESGSTSGSASGTGVASVAFLGGPGAAGPWVPLRLVRIAFLAA